MRFFLCFFFIVIGLWPFFSSKYNRTKNNFVIFGKQNGYNIGTDNYVWKHEIYCSSEKNHFECGTMAFFRYSQPSFILVWERFEFTKVSKTVSAIESTLSIDYQTCCNLWDAQLTMDIRPNFLSIGRLISQKRS
jgi:hypothetical protein